MKRTLLSALSLLAIGIAPAWAGDGQVPQSTLSHLGLGGLSVMSDNDGLSVRGSSSRVFISGRSFVAGQVAGDDDTVAGSRTFSYRSTRTNLAGNLGGRAIRGETDNGSFFGFSFGGSGAFAF